jgi:hypothetical protein
MLPMLTGPNISLSIYLSKMRKVFSSFAVKFQVSDQYVTTGLKVAMPALNLAPRYEVRWRNGVITPRILISSVDGREWRDNAPFVLTRKKFHQ